MEKAIQGLVTQSEDNIKAAMAIKNAVESILDEADENSLELFSTKILSQIQNIIPEAKPDEAEYWRKFINIPIRNGRYFFQLNYDWKSICIEKNETNKKSDSREEDVLYNKISELTGMPGKNKDLLVWISDKFKYPRLANIEPDLYFIKLNKEYLENTTEVVNLILNYVNELNKA